MNCLLIYPYMPDTFYTLKHAVKIAGKKAIFPPLGLLTVASLLPKDWTLELCDCNITQLTHEKLQWAEIVLVSGMNVQEESVREILVRCRQYKVKVVAGGPLFTHEFERFDNVDHFVLNEAEITLPLFLDDLKNGTPQRIYTTTEFADITKSPLPRYDLINLDDYLQSIVQYSRGCPYLCDFCDVTALFGRRPRVKTPEQIISELDSIRQNSKSTAVIFADDNLIGNKRVLKSELLPKLIEWQKNQEFGFWFSTQVTVNVADDEQLLSMLGDAGFRTFFIGLETPQEDALKDARKTQNLKRDLHSTIEKIQNKGFTIYAGFIIGFDADTPESYAVISEFIQESGIPLPIVNILKAPPGTELFDRMKKEGRLTKDFAFEEGETNILPVLPLQDILKGFINIVNEIYMIDKSYERFKKYMSQHQLYKSSVKIKAKYYFSDYIQFLKILFTVGVVSKHRIYFWKVMWLARNHGAALQYGLLMALLGIQMHEHGLYLLKQAEKQLSEIEQQKKVA